MPLPTVSRKTPQSRATPRSHAMQPMFPRSGNRQQLLQLLRCTFGFNGLRPGQQEAIEQVVAGRHVFAVMPTGAGKSLCYQLPALLDGGGVTLVISPLISLMKDQCDKLQAMGVHAVALNSANNAADEGEALAAVEAGSARLLFTTPERLATDSALIAALRRQEVRLLVIDEAHCLTQWGHDFRPAFLELGAARVALGTPPVLALSATATPDMISEVARQLAVDDFTVINASVYRANLHYRVEAFAREEERLERLLALVAATPGSGIVYAATIRAAESAYALLEKQGESVGLYHARRPASARREVQERFMAGEMRVVVATNAFGLGIDKPDTRFVIHCQMPASLDAYYQESGRAGRDGEVAECTLLYQARDRSVQGFFMTGRYPVAAEVRALYRALSEPPPVAAGQSGVSSGWTVEQLEQGLDLPKSRLRVLLALLREHGIVAMNRQRRLRLRRTDLDAHALDGLLDDYRERAQHDREMLERMLFYVRSGRCRWRVLLEHFDEEAPFDSCGSCDSCRMRQDYESAPVLAAPVARAPRRQRASPPAAPALAPGQSVRVPRYGEARVESTDSEAETVDLVFPDGKRRSFMAAYVEVSTPD